MVEALSLGQVLVLLGKEAEVSAFAPSTQQYVFTILLFHVEVAGTCAPGSQVREERRLASFPEAGLAAEGSFLSFLIMCFCASAGMNPHRPSIPCRAGNVICAMFLVTRTLNDHFSHHKHFHLGFLPVSQVNLCPTNGNTPLVTCGIM